MGFKRLRMAIRTAICCSSEHVMMYENERNRQLPSPLIRLIWFGGLRSTFGPPGLSLFDITN